MSYKPLIEGQRYQIQAYWYERLSYREIGRRLKMSHSSISREIKRHSIKSKMYLIRKVPSKSTEGVCRAIGSMLWRYRRHVYMITGDNGTEFCAHERVTRKLKTDVYFAILYAYWERGLNENVNGLLRQYIPKGADLRKVSDGEIARVERSLNLRPRKCLGFI